MTPINTLSDSSLLRRSCIIIPTFNAGQYWGRLQAALETQGIDKEQILVVDSSSTDNTQNLVRQAGYLLKTIPTASFRHGATRQMATEIMSHADFFVLLTQDAIPSEKDSIKNLLSAFRDPHTGAAYGRQIPRDAADAIEIHSRLFNYREASEIRTLDSRKTLGIKAAFFSNSFAAYRRTAFEQVGGFPTRAIMAEDAIVVARMLLAGWSVAYQADAAVYHSHSLSLRQEFARYFDTGVYHKQEPWLLKEFGSPQGEGLRFVKSEMTYLAQNAPSRIPMAVVRTIGKWCAYQLGLREPSLPIDLVEAISASPSFWQDRRREEQAMRIDDEVSGQTAHAPRH